MAIVGGLDLPLLVVGYLDGDAPMLAATVAEKGRRDVVLAIPLTNEAEAAALLTTGRSARFDGVRQGGVLRLHRRRGGRPPSLHLAAGAGHLLVATAPSALEVGPWLVASEAPGAMGVVGAPGVRVLWTKRGARRLAADGVEAARDLVTQLRAADVANRLRRGRAPDFGEPRAVLSLADALIEALAATGGSARGMEGELRFPEVRHSPPGPAKQRAESPAPPLRWTLSGRVQVDATSGVGPSLAALRPPTARATAAAACRTSVAWGTTPAARSDFGRTVGELLIETFPKLTTPRKQELSRRLATLASVAGASTHVCHRPGTHTVAVTLATDPARLATAIDGGLGALRWPALAAPMKAHGASIDALPGQGSTVRVLRFGERFALHVDALDEATAPPGAAEVVASWRGIDGAAGLTLDVAPMPSEAAGGAEGLGIELRIEGRGGVEGVLRRIRELLPLGHGRAEP